MNGSLNDKFISGKKEFIMFILIWGFVFGLFEFKENECCNVGWNVIEFVLGMVEGKFFLLLLLNNCLLIIMRDSLLYISNPGLIVSLSNFLFERTIYMYYKAFNLILLLLCCIWSVLFS